MSDKSGFTSLEECFKKYIPVDELQEVKRILFGRSDEYEENSSNISCSITKNCLFFSSELQVNDDAKKIAETNNFVIQSYGFSALPEDLRPTRIVRIAAVQNSIVAPTTETISTQRDLIFKKIGNIIDAAGADNVNVLCLQEAWSNWKFRQINFVH